MNISLSPYKILLLYHKNRMQTLKLSLLLACT